MSIVAMVGIAAVCAAVIGYERWQVRREAKRRLADRRARRTVSWDDQVSARPFWDGLRTDPLGSDLHHADATDRLRRQLERTVLIGEEAFVYRKRFEARRGVSESPFQIRRGKMEVAIHRYATALGAVCHAARTWLATVTPGEGDDRRRHAVARMLDSVTMSGADRAPMSFERIAATLDLIENTLANLSMGPSSGPRVHPFR